MISTKNRIFCLSSIRILKKRTMFIVLAQVLSFLALILQIPLLIWNVKQKNVPLLCLIGWYWVLNINTFLSTFVWSSPNVIEWFNGSGYCDMMVRIIAGGHVGVFCAVTAISRKLAIIMSDEGPKIELNSFQARMIDLCICMVMPVILMIIIYIAQVHRYALYQYMGCTLFLTNTWVVIPCYIVWPMVLAMAATGYTWLALARYTRKRNDFKDLLHTTNSGVSSEKFKRLLIYTIVITIVMLPLTIYVAVSNLKIVDVHLAYSWSSAHDMFGEILRIPEPGFVSDMYLYGALGILQFLCFGTGKELVDVYKQVFRITQDPSQQGQQQQQPASTTKDKILNKMVGVFKGKRVRRRGSGSNRNEFCIN